jgi:hypothetical protein
MSINRNKRWRESNYGNKGYLRSRNEGTICDAFQLNEESVKSLTVDRFQSPSIRQSKDLKGVWQYMSTDFGRYEVNQRDVFETPLDNETNYYRTYEPMISVTCKISLFSWR